MNLELVCLAADAALEITNHRLGESQEVESVHYLSSLLDKATQGDNPAAIEPCYVLGFAISGRENPEEHWKGRTNASEVLLQINLVAKDLRDFKSLPQVQTRISGGFLCQTK